MCQLFNTSVARNIHFCVYSHCAESAKRKQPVLPSNPVVLPDASLNSTSVNLVASTSPAAIIRRANHICKITSSFAWLNHIISRVVVRYRNDPTLMHMTLLVHFARTLPTHWRTLPLAVEHHYAQLTSAIEGMRQEEQHLMQGPPIMQSTATIVVSPPDAQAQAMLPSGHVASSAASVVMMTIESPSDAAAAASSTTGNANFTVDPNLQKQAHNTVDQDMQDLAAAAYAESDGERTPKRHPSVDHDPMDDSMPPLESFTGVPTAALPPLYLLMSASASSGSLPVSHSQVVSPPQPSVSEPVDHLEQADAMKDVPYTQSDAPHITEMEVDDADRTMKAAAVRTRGTKRSAAPADSMPSTQSAPPAAKCSKPMPLLPNEIFSAMLPDDFAVRNEMLHNLLCHPELSQQPAIRIVGESIQELIRRMKNTLEENYSLDPSNQRFRLDLYHAYLAAASNLLKLASYLVQKPLTAGKMGLCSEKQAMWIAKLLQQTRHTLLPISMDSNAVSSVTGVGDCATERKYDDHSKDRIVEYELSSSYLRNNNVTQCVLIENEHARARLLA